MTPKDPRTRKALKSNRDPPPKMTTRISTRYAGNRFVVGSVFGLSPSDGRASPTIGGSRCHLFRWSTGRSPARQFIFCDMSAVRSANREDDLRPILCPPHGSPGSCSKDHVKLPASLNHSYGLLWQDFTPGKGRRNRCPVVLVMAFLEVCERGPTRRPLHCGQTHPGAPAWDNVPCVS